MLIVYFLNLYFIFVSFSPVNALKIIVYILIKTVLKQFKQILITLILVTGILPAFAQNKHNAISVKHLQAKKIKTSGSAQLAEFIALAADAGVSFSFPKGFKEKQAPDNEDFSFDYAMTLPGKDFEIWLQVKSQKENWASYVKSKNTNAEQANPDSSYIAVAQAHAAALTGGNDYFIRNIPPDVLARYNADAGKSYLLNLRDLPATNHYKYALLITLQKDHTGIILAVCFTNEKGPEFFKNMDKASNCLKFK